MLFPYRGFDHPVDQLQRHICFFMRSARCAADAGRRFDVRKLFHPVFQKRLRRAWKLRKLFNTFYRAFKALSAAERIQVYRAFRRSLDTRRLFRGHCACPGISSLPLVIHQPMRNLFEHLYDHTLGSIGDVRQHYEKHYHAIPSNLCPFCGIERLEHYSHYKQDYDHQMPQETYPFAAVNMRNLVPMGQACNKVFKKREDMLHDARGHRRKAFYPFDPPGRITVSLAGSTLPTGGADKGRWAVSIGPNIEEVDTWNQVFKIEDRYRKTILEADYDAWLRSFRNYVRDVAGIPQPWTGDKIRAAVESFQRQFPEDDFRDHMFFKRAVCDLWMNDTDAFFLKALGDSVS